MILNVLRGDTTSFVLDVPADLDTYDFTFTVKRHLLDADADAVISQGPLTVSSDTVKVDLAAADTDQFSDAERLYWDLQGDDGNGGIITPLRGTMVIAADVTLTASEPS